MIIRIKIYSKGFNTHPSLRVSTNLRILQYGPVKHTVKLMTYSNKNVKISLMEEGTKKREDNLINIFPSTLTLKSHSPICDLRMEICNLPPKTQTYVHFNTYSSTKVRGKQCLGKKGGRRKQGIIDQMKYLNTKEYIVPSMVFTFSYK